MTPFHQLLLTSVLNFIRILLLIKQCSFKNHKNFKVANQNELALPSPHKFRGVSALSRWQRVSPFSSCQKLPATYYLVILCNSSYIGSINDKNVMHWNPFKTIHFRNPPTSDIRIISISFFPYENFYTLPFLCAFSR